MSVGHTLATRFLTEQWSPRRLAQEIDRVMLADLADRRMPPISAYRRKPEILPQHIKDDA